MHTRRAWVLIGALTVVTLIMVPVFNQLPAESALHLPDYLIPLFGKFLCYAMVA